jgi:membrane protein insertase Oxa1/YidC/SpoIIIJ
MAKMKKLGPEMQRLKEQYGDDKAGMQKEMMALYKRERLTQLQDVYLFYYRYLFSLHYIKFYL